MSGFTGTSAYLLITPDQRVLLTDDRYVPQATAQCPEFEVINHRTVIRVAAATEHASNSWGLTVDYCEQP